MYIYICVCVTTAVCVCRTICLYVWPSQPGKVANPARGQQLNRENGLFAVPSRVSLLISTLQAESISACGIPPEFRGGVHSLSVHIRYYECSSVYMYSSIYYVR